MSLCRTLESFPLIVRSEKALYRIAARYAHWAYMKKRFKRMKQMMGISDLDTLSIKLSQIGS